MVKKIEKAVPGRVLIARLTGDPWSQEKPQS